MLSVAAVFCDYYNSPDDCEWHYKPCGADCMKTCRNPSGDCSNLTTAMEGRLDRSFGILSSWHVFFLTRLWVKLRPTDWQTGVLLIQCLNVCHSYRTHVCYLVHWLQTKQWTKRFMAFCKTFCDSNQLIRNFMPCLPKGLCPYCIVFWQKSIRIKCFVLQWENKVVHVDFYWH